MPRFPPNPDVRPAVVTGASSGIGRATAVALAAQGHPVVLGARRVSECEDAAAAIRSDGGEAVAIHLDLADGASVERFARAAVDTLGAVEIVVSNAGQNMAGAVLDTDPASLDAVLSVNITGTHRLVRALLPDMVGRRRGDRLRSSLVPFRGGFGNVATIGRWGDGRGNRVRARDLGPRRRCWLTAPP